MFSIKPQLNSDIILQSNYTVKLQLSCCTKLYFTALYF